MQPVDDTGVNFHMFSAAVGMLVSLWVSLAVSIQILMILMFMDMITGLMVASRKGTLSSSVGTAGVLKKASILIVLLVTHLLQFLIEQQVSAGFALPIHLSAAVALAYVVIESVSIVENCHNLGAPIPTFLSKALKKAGELTDEGQV